MSGYLIEPLAGHDRQAFRCGVEPLDRYFLQQVSQDIRRRIARCFVAVGPEEDIAGYYTLAATSLPLEQLPPERARKLPRYPVVPAVLLSRLAVSTAHQGRRLGAALVADAIQRCTRSEIVGHVLLLDAKGEAAARFYAHLEFTRLDGEPARFIRPL